MVLAVSGGVFSFMKEAALGKGGGEMALEFTWCTLKAWSQSYVVLPVWQDAPGILRSISLKGLKKAGGRVEVSNELYMKPI